MVQFARDLINGVDFLHNNGIAHLGINPQNLVYTRGYRLQIIDFNISQWIQNDDQRLRWDQRLYMTGNRTGGRPTSVLQPNQG